MGLDMYANTTNRRISSPVDFKGRDSDPLIHQWRKHPNLHGWMEELYRRKGGKQQFNCTTVQLTSDDVDSLERAIETGALPETVGFFFGVTDGTEKDDDLEFIAKARAALADGLTVYYHSWW